MHKLLEKLKKDHRNLEKILALLTTQLDHFFAGRESDFDLKIELLEYIEIYADQGHHRLENLIFKTAMEGMGDDKEMVDRLLTEHNSLISQTRKFRQSLEGVLQGDVMLRDELEGQGRAYIALQRQHIALEEREVFPLLDRLITVEAWEQIVEKMPEQEDPVFDAPDKIRFQTLVDYLASSEADPRLGEAE